jgi:hypothetical protein
MDVVLRQSVPDSVPDGVRLVLSDLRCVGEVVLASSLE